MGGMQRLTAASISAQYPEQDLASITSLSFPKRGIKEIVGLDACEKLSRLDLSNNNLTSLEGLALCANLKWLSVAGNCLQSLKGIEGLSKMTVLNASHNELTTMDEVACLVDLRAVILNDNEITSVCKLDRLTNLNALVLSHNPIRELDKSLGKLSSITKLSMSYCRLQTVGSSLKRNTALKELRLSHNQLMSLPLELEQNGMLQILDVGHNYLRQWSDIEVLSSLHELRNLNLHGNPVCEEKRYQEKIKELLPKLQILDAHPVLNIQKHQNTKKMSSDGNNPVREGQEDANGTSKMLIPCQSKVLEDNPKRNSMKSKDKVKKEQEIGKDESDEDKPFIDFIAPGQKTVEPMIDAAIKNRKRNLEESSDVHTFKAKVESGVVAILGGDKKGNAPKGKISKVGHVFLQNHTEIEIGTGGPSSWDTNPVENKPQVPEANNSAPSQNAYPCSSSSYSRWRLKSHINK